MNRIINASNWPKAPKKSNAALYSLTNKVMQNVVKPRNMNRSKIMIMKRFMNQFTLICRLSWRDSIFEIRFIPNNETNRRKTEKVFSHSRIKLFATLTWAFFRGRFMSFCSNSINFQELSVDAFFAEEHPQNSQVLQDCFLLRLSLASSKYS